MIAESLPPASQSSQAPTVVPSICEETEFTAPVEVLDAETLGERYTHLRDESEKLVEQGRFEEALECLEKAAATAEEIGDEEMVAMARCNVASVAFSLGRTDHIGDLRAVLMRNFSADTSFAAAYNLSHVYELLKEFKKSLFYGRIARDRAQAAKSDGLLAKSLNQLGNALVGDSRFQDAVGHYHQALAMMPRENGGMSAMPRINCAYCLIVLGQTHEGMAQLFTALRWLKRNDLHPVYQTWAHLFLCCGYLELDRLRRSWIHGMKALELAERTGEQSSLRSALFMLGEVERVAGDTIAARDWFAQMQRRFYPDDPQMPELLSVVGMTRVVNLRA